DLESLFNTRNLETVRDLSPYPRVANATLNYGFRDLAGKTISGVDKEKLKEWIEQAIQCYEPRLLPPDDSTKTVHVEEVPATKKVGGNVASIRIVGRLWADPVPRPIALRARFDLDGGTATVTQENDDEAGR
ncbi:MAG: GPW/gp25 family protein, partial [Planctomycetota bacterium]